MSFPIAQINKNPQVLKIRKRERKLFKMSVAAEVRENGTRLSSSPNTPASVIDHWPPVDGFHLKPRPGFLSKMMADRKRCSDEITPVKIDAVASAVATKNQWEAVQHDNFSAGHSLRALGS